MKRERKNINQNKKTKNVKFNAKQKQSFDINISLKNKLIALFAILLLTFAAYYPALDNEFTNWDDKQYVIENPYLKSFDAETVKTIFSEPSYMGNYHPLAMLSLNIDYMLGGEDADGNINPFPFHLINILLHLLVTALVFILILRLSGNFMISVIAALLFGTHTLHVESVAWVSERKDVLYAVFFVASLISYLKYIDTEKKKFYILSLILFILSLLSKAQAVSLAVSLLAFDYFRDRKLLSKQVIIEKIPFFILALITGITAVKAQMAGDAIVSGDAYVFYQRIAFAGYAFTMYLLQLILPLNLSAMYPYPDIINKTMPAYYWLGLIPSALTVWAFIKTYKTNKPVAFSVAFFLINIFLLLQLLPVGSAVHADRYAYIPSISFFFLVGILLNAWKERIASHQTIIYGLVGVYTLALIMMSMQRCDIWQNSMTLWNDTVKKSPKAVTAWNNRGSEFDRMAKFEAEHNNNQKANEYRMLAISDFSKAIKGKPDYSNAMYNRGSSRYELAKATKNPELLNLALADFNDALTYNMRFAAAYHQRGNVKSELADYEKDSRKQQAMLQAALEDFDIAVNITPEDGGFYVNRGVTKGKLGFFEDAISDFDKSIQLSGENYSVLSNRGLAKSNIAKFYKEGGINKSTGKFIFKPEITDTAERQKLASQYYADAISDYDKAIALDQTFTTAYHNRGLVNKATGKYEDALRDFTKVTELNPNFVEAYYMRALVNYGLDNKSEDALRDFTKVIELRPDYPDAYFMRGILYYNLGYKSKSCADLANAEKLGHPYAGIYRKEYCK